MPRSPLPPGIVPASKKADEGGIRANSEGLKRLKQLDLSNLTDSAAKKQSKYRCKCSRYWRIGWYWPCLLQLASGQTRQHRRTEVADVPPSVLRRLFGLEPWRSWSFLVDWLLVHLQKRFLHKGPKSFGFVWTTRSLILLDCVLTDPTDPNKGWAAVFSPGCK